MKLALILFAGCMPLVADLAAIKAEPNLERRSDLALQNADAALTRAREAYRGPDEKLYTAALAEVAESLDLCKQSLDESGKNPRKRPKYFKKAELGLRQLVRRLDTFRTEVSVDDRKAVDDLHKRAEQVEDDILHAIMGHKK